MKKRLILVFFCLISVFSVSAQKNYTSEKIVFLPQVFYVGDLVEMRVVIVPDKRVTVSRPESFPDSYWVRIENAEVVEDNGKYELRIFLRSFAPGIRALPAIKFGDVVLRDIRIQTASVLEQNPLPLAPPAQQILLPGTKYYIALFTGLVFLLPVFFIFFWTKLKTRIRNYVDEQKRKKPYRRFQRVLKELKDALADQSSREFYTILIDELRIYLSSRGSIDYVSATVKESSRVIRFDFRGIRDREALIKLLLRADEVKFGHRDVLEITREADLVKIIKIVEEIELLPQEGVTHADI